MTTATARNENATTVNLTLGKLEVALEITSQTTDTLIGTLTLPKHAAGMNFTWKRSQYPTPYVWAIYGSKAETAEEANRKAKEFAGMVLQAYADNVVIDNGGVTQGMGSGELNYTSQMLVNAHTRRPHVVYRGGSVFIRKATIVNELKLDADEHRAAQTVVNRWNMLVELFNSEGHEVGNFGQWLERQGLA